MRGLILRHLSPQAECDLRSPGSASFVLHSSQTTLPQSPFPSLDWTTVFTLFSPITEQVERPSPPRETDSQSSVFLSFCFWGQWALGAVSSVLVPADWQTKVKGEGSGVKRAGRDPEEKQRGERVIPSKQLVIFFAGGDVLWACIQSASPLYRQRRQLFLLPTPGQCVWHTHWHKMWEMSCVHVCMVSLYKGSCQRSSSPPLIVSLETCLHSQGHSGLLWLLLPTTRQQSKHYRRRHNQHPHSYIIII